MRRFVVDVPFLFLGFFLDINLFKVNKEGATEISKDDNMIIENANGGYGMSTSNTDGLADEDANLMIKLKFLTYKVRKCTFLEVSESYRTICASFLVNYNN